MTLEQRRSVLIAYLKERTEFGDWHGVSDAANDLRVLDETIRMTINNGIVYQEKQPKPSSYTIDHKTGQISQISGHIYGQQVGQKNAD